MGTGRRADCACIDASRVPQPARPVRLLPQAIPHVVVQSAYDQPPTGSKTTAPLIPGSAGRDAHLGHEPRLRWCREASGVSVWPELAQQFAGVAANALPMQRRVLRRREFPVRSACSRASRVRAVRDMSSSDSDASALAKHRSSGSRGDGRDGALPAPARLTIPTRSGAPRRSRRRP